MSTSNVKPIPEGYLTVTPSLVFKNASKAMDFYKELFNAKEKYRLEYKNKMVHAEMKIGESVIMLSDEMPEMNSLSAETIGNSPIQLYIYVENVDDTFNKAIKMGAKPDHPVQTQFYGDRIGAITDPFGFKWTIATHVKNVPMDEIKKNLADFVNKMGKSKSLGDDFKEKYLIYKQKYLELQNKVKQT